MSDIKLRSLKAKDSKRLAKILSQNIDAMKKFSKIDKEDENARKEVGFEIIKSILENHVEEIWDWLADLNGMTTEELDEAAIETPILIIKEIGESEGFKSFLGSASGLLQKDAS